MPEERLPNKLSAKKENALKLTRRTRYKDALKASTNDVKINSKHQWPSLVASLQRVNDECPLLKIGQRGPHSRFTCFYCFQKDRTIIFYLNAVAPTKQRSSSLYKEKRICLKESIVNANSESVDLFPKFSKNNCSTLAKIGLARHQKVVNTHEQFLF